MYFVKVSSYGPEGSLQAEFTMKHFCSERALPSEKTNAKQAPIVAQIAKHPFVHHRELANRGREEKITDHIYSRCHSHV